jgi:hypothetical protein
MIMAKHYKKEEEKRRERQRDVKLKIVSGYGDIIGENTLLQKSKHKRKTWRDK